MGKNRKSSNGTGRNVQDFSESNNNALNPIIEDLIKQSEDTELFSGLRTVLRERAEELREFLEYCNSNNLEIIPSEVRDFFNGHEYSPQLSIRDHDNGRQYNIYTTHVGMLGEYRERIMEARNAIASLPSNFVKNVEEVNFVHGYDYPSIIAAGVLGKFMYEPSIYIHSYAFDSKYTWESGTRGVFVHEMAHNYDFYGLGKGKGSANGVFGKYGADTDNPIGPTQYATDRPHETISTVCEQVYTHTLRRDATMRNGDSVEKAYYERYGTSPSSNDADKMYDLWYDEWRELTVPAEEMMGL